MIEMIDEREPCLDERELWAAVLRQAIIDLTNADGCAPHERPRIQYFTTLWFTSDNRDVGSYFWICEHFDINALWFRRWLFAMIDAAPVSRPQFWHGRKNGSPKPFGDCALF
jgi:hypothetical protein